MHIHRSLKALRHFSLANDKDFALMCSRCISAVKTIQCFFSEPLTLLDMLCTNKVHVQ